MAPTVIALGFLARRHVEGDRGVRAPTPWFVVAFADNRIDSGVPCAFHQRQALDAATPAAAAMLLGVKGI